MKRTSKLLCTLLAAFMFLSLVTGCQKPVDPDKPEPTPSEDEGDKEPEKIVYTIDNIRQYVVGVDEPVQLSDGTTQPLINFDNAATTPPLVPVMEYVDNEMKMYGSIGRGFSQKSNHSTDIYNEVRDKVLNFVGADPDYHTVFYANSTTD
ncbi:MAG: aminotransferase class V-fold PLP-dependent enzyme, partial [Erysipelotrichaceae bacterium]|nr:aminotransferase class V-fold PLP-dependent enzyme [Erysipelotrichaceae bacterium]